MFLVADKRLYKRLCPSIRPSVGRSVNTSRKVEKRAFPPLPTRPRLALAVCSTLFELCLGFRFSFIFMQIPAWASIPSDVSCLAEFPTVIGSCFNIVVAATKMLLLRWTRHPTPSPTTRGAGTLPASALRKLPTREKSDFG